MCLLQKGIIYVMLRAIFNLSCAASSIAILPFQNGTGDTNSDHWGYTISTMVGKSLGALKAVCPVPSATLEFVFRETGIRTDAKLTAQEAFQIGQMTKAVAVVSGTIGHKGDSWSLDMEFTPLSSGVASRVFCAGSAWSNVVLQAVGNILQQMSLTVPSDSEIYCLQAFKGSEKALEQFSLGLDLSHKQLSVSAVYSNLNLAITFDQNCAAILDALAQSFIFQGRLVAAELVAKRAVKLSPDRSHGHSTLASVHAFRGRLDLARTEAEKAVALDSCDSGAYSRLGEILLEQHKVSDSISAFKKAKERSPYDSDICGELGLAYARNGQAELARQEIAEAERFHASNHISATLSLAKAYETLKDTNTALLYFEKFENWSTQLGAPTSTIKPVRDKLEHSGRTLATSLVAQNVPLDLTKENLRNIYRHKLSSRQQRLIDDPLAITQEMEIWAKRATSGSTNPLEMAERLFKALQTPDDAPDESPESLRTAAQAFHARLDPRQNLTCQDYAFLYTALARSVGLKSYVVLVDRDYRGKLVSHACAGVVLGEKAVLVDLAYSWFGVPHKDYEFEDDLRVSILYLVGSHDRRKQEAGLALSQDWAPPFFQSALDSALHGRTRDARRLLQSGLELDSQGWLAAYTRGVIEVIDENWVEGANALSSVLAINPDEFVARYLLATALLHQARLVEARREYERCLENDTLVGKQAEAMSRDIGKALDQIDKRLKRARSKSGTGPVSRVTIKYVTMD
jgi:Flp pilus assembly protein TadD